MQMFQSNIGMISQLHLEKKKFRHWAKAMLGIKYLNEGIAPFCDDVARQQHEVILDNIRQSKNLQSVTCAQCALNTLKPDHVKSGKKQCPLGQANCNCWYEKDKWACCGNVCGAIYDTIITYHANKPPAPYWKNTNSHMWTRDPWSIAKCFINSPGYDQASSAADTDCMGLLHVIINNKYFHNHVGSNMANAFSKVRQDRNEIFHSSTMELEEAEANAYIDDMIAALQDGEELKNRQDAQDAVNKLEELKNKDFIITTQGGKGGIENALVTIFNKLEDLEQTTKKLTLRMSKENKTDTIRHEDQKECGYIEGKPDKATQQLNPKTSSDDTEETIISVNRPVLKDKDKSEELKQHERTLYTNLHEIEDSRNIPNPTNDKDVETWYINCTPRWHGAPEHIFYYGIFDTIIKRIQELPELKCLTLTDMIIGRHTFSLSITEKDIACLKDLDSDSKFRKIGSMILAKYAEKFCFDKDDFRTEDRKSRSFASYIVLDMICRMCVMENNDIYEAYPALEESKGELMIFCISTRRSCLSEYKRFSIREISFDGTSTESMEAENLLDKDDANVTDLIRRYGIEVNETLSHHILRLMDKHSNLEAAKVSFVRSTKTGYDYSEPCIVLYCLGKTLVPYGEDLFPVSLQHPTKYKTFKTEVREGYYRTCHNTSTSKHQELAMGCSIGKKGQPAAATLGPLVEFVESGKMGFLTVRHLFKPTTISDILLPGTEIVQPSDQDVMSPSSSSDDRVCGKVVTSHMGDQIDAALVQISPDRIPQRGNFIEVDKRDLNFAGFRIDQQPTFDDGATIDARTLTTQNGATRRIVKVGSASGLTKGTLSTTSGAVRERSETLEYSHNGRTESRIINSQLFVDSYISKVFCQQGDSGSAVFLVEDDENNKLKCIGMVIGYVVKDFACVITPIQNILHVLHHKCGEEIRLKEFHFEEMQG